jgi:hypothetical protein
MFRALAMLAAIGATGCSGLPNELPSLSGPTARQSIDRTLGVRLRKQALPDSPQLVNVAAMYAGSRDGRGVLAVIFDSSTATTQVIGKVNSRLPGADVVRVANVVVLLQGWPEVDQGVLSTALRNARHD